MSDPGRAGASSLPAVTIGAILSAALALAVLGLVLATPAQARVAREFIGIYVPTPLMERTGVLNQESVAMAEAGVGSVRSVFDWAGAQPYARLEDVPPAERGRFRLESGVPTDWSQIDRQVAAAVRNGIGILPVVMAAPAWASDGHWTRPRSAGAYGRFVGALARRFGPFGHFWGEHPELPRAPLRDWQLWNEPNFRDYWEPQPFARRYVAFLRRARLELRRVDARARIVLAGIANRSWGTLDRLYRLGAAPYFDAAAVHPFTRDVEGVAEILRRNREVMLRHGDGRTPMMVTEVTWTSGPAGAEHSSGTVSDEQGQAVRVSEVFRLLAGRRRALGIERVYWLSWLSTDRGGEDIFNWSGLSRVRPDNTVERKPAFHSFRDVAHGLTGCGSGACPR
jgi:hypothetical protein